MTYKSIPGYCDYHRFYDCVLKKMPDSFTMAEVGVWFGHSVAYMGQLVKASSKTARIFAVDTFRGSPNEKQHQKVVQEHGGSIYSAFENNMKACGVWDIVQPVENDSAYAPGYIGEMMDFVFLDAEHEYLAVKLDIVAWWPWIKVGGIIAGHDYCDQWPGVKLAVDELMPDRKLDGSVWYYIKQSDKL